MNNIIQECLENNISKISEIIVYVKNNLSLLKKERDSKKLELSNLNFKINELNLFLKQIEKKEQKQSIVVSTTWEELPICVQDEIFNILEKLIHNNRIHLAVLHKNISDSDQNKNIIIAANWLFDQNIISRLASNLKKGSNWENRPKKQ